MAFQLGTTGYFDDLIRRNWMTWLLSGLAATGLNLALFLLMPHLMQPARSRASIETLVPQVNVIRIKRQESEVRRKAVKPPEPPESKTVKGPKAPPNHPVQTKLTLPFEINPRLPSGPNTLNLPAFETTPPVNAGLPDAFSVGQLDAPLTVLTRIPPVYPLRAKQRGIEGWVRVKFIVDETGAVGRVAIVEAQPAGVFEQSVERCVSGWRFKPGTVDGMPVKAEVETTIRFQLE